VKKGAVCSDILDHTSALKHIENAFKLPALSMRDAAALDLSGCLDGGSTTPSKPIQLPVVEVDESMLMGCSGSSIMKPYDHDILAWADANPGRLGKLDLRAESLDYVYGIAEYLDKHNLGRIRRGR
jgi:hypothetical protein